MNTLIERLFSLKEHKTTISREFFAALTTFSTMAYIIFVNPMILKDAGLDFGAVMSATIITTALSSLLMGIWANYPYALAPGMGINAYIAYSVIQQQNISWQAALGASFFAGLIFLVLNLSGIRRKIIEALPVGLQHGTAAGIGLFLVVIGFSHSIETHPALMMFGTIAAAILVWLDIKGALLIVTVSLWGWALAQNEVPFEGFFGIPPSLDPTLFHLDFMGALEPKTLLLMLSLVFVTLFDTAGSLAALGSLQKGTHQKDGLRLQRAMDTDGIGTMLGAIFGTTPVTTYLESATGISTGGRTGLVAVFVALFFLLFLFLTPFAASIPPFATSPALIVIGFLMAKNIRKIDREDIAECASGWLTFLLIPLAFSIGTGVGAGLIAYPILKFMVGEGKAVPTLVYIITALFAAVAIGSLL